VRRRIGFLAAVVICSAIAGWLVALRLTGTTAPPREAPNVVVILTDDQRWDTLWAMPTVKSALQGKGVTFANAFVVNPLCCPSRTSILTGRYSHSTGVYTNAPPRGGFQVFDDRSTLPTWLRDAGYRTALIGKYLNGYDERYIPPGWDRWIAFTGTPGFDRYGLNVDGELRVGGPAPGEYSTDVLADQAVSFIRDTEGPMFLYFAPYAPHRPATPAPRHASAFEDLGPWRPPSYDEPDVSDKPAWVRALPRLDSEARAVVDQVRLDQYRSLLAVDDAVGRIVDALSETGRLSETFIVFTSDNGFAWGEHRWEKKQVAYEESIRVPLVVRYDPIATQPRSDGNLVLNIDLAPTISELAGTSAPEAEGRSFVQLLRGDDDGWRTDFLVEHLVGDEALSPPTFCAVRSTGFLFVAYDTGARELYDLARDPAELLNRAADPRMASVRRRLAARLAELCRPPPDPIPGLSR
jgi:N-acetylglucosamine-6-sulfatase